MVPLAAAADAMRETVPLDAAEHVPAPERERPKGNIGRRVYWTIRWRLEANGSGSLAADRVALRSARGCVLEAEKVKDAESARVLGVTDRTLRLDRARLRALPPAELADADGLPPVPTPADRISPRGGDARR